MQTQERRLALPHARPNAAEARPLRRDRRSGGGERRHVPADARHRRLAAGRRQRGGIHPPRQGACPIHAGGRGSQLERFVDNPSPPLQNRPTQLRVIFRLFSYFARRRRTASLPNVRNVKQSSTPTAKKTKTT